MADTAAAFPARSWARLVYRPGSGIIQALGDCDRVFGASARSLVESRDPLRLIPARLASVLSSGVPESPILLSFGNLTGVVVPFAVQAEIILFEVEGQGDRTGFPMDDLGAGVLGLDRAGMIRLWNSTMSEMFSLPDESPLGRSIESVLPPPLLQSWSGVVASALDGRQVRVEIRPSQNKRIEGTFRMGGTGIVGTLFDTSDGFEIERRLRTARRMNQTYLQAVRAGIVLFDQDYRLLVANRAFGALFNLREGLIGMPLYDIVPRESFAELEKLSRRLFDGEQDALSVTVSYTDKDGTGRSVLQTFRPVRSEDEESFMVVGVFEDVTDQMNVILEADRCRASQEEMAALMKAISNSRLPANATGLAEQACRALSATASAIYLFEPYSTTRLAGCSGSWSAFLPDDFSELRLPPSVWNTSPWSMLTGPELGLLRGRVECCCVFPMGQGSANRGFLVAGFDSPEEAGKSLHAGSMASDLIRSKLETSGMSSQLEQMTYLLEKQRRFFRDAISMFDTPVAVFGEDWRVLHWNRAMENLTGCPAETAKKRSSMVIDMLFGPVGGVASARRIARRGLSGGAPASWEIRRVDGTAVSTSWRMARVDAAEGDVVESVTLLAGIPEQPCSEGDSGALSNEGFDSLGRSLIRLVSARSAAQLAEALALAASGMSGGASAVVEIDSPDGAVRARHSLGSDEDTQSWSSFPIQMGSVQYGSLMVDGVSHGALLADFTRAAARVIENLDETSLGAVVSAVFAGAGSRFAVCDHNGKLIDADAGSESGGRRASATVAQFFGVAEELAVETIRAAIKQGRSAMDDGRGGTVVMSSLGIPGGSNVVFAWKAPSGTRLDLLSGHPLSGPSGLSAIAAALPGAIGRLRDRLQGISRLLAGDDPVRPEIASACLEASALRKMSHYMGLFSRCLNPCDGACRAGEVLDRVVDLCVRRGRRPPDLYIEGDIPEIDIEPGILTEILDLLCEAGGCGGQVEIRVRHSTQALMASPSGRSGMPLVQFAVSWRTARAACVPLGEALESACRGVFDTGTELALAGLALRMCSCDLSPGEDGLSATVSIPRI
ncbi:PAS domain-containing protein [Candidatus Fermentibacteria bacterium]|nr:PAS domain-containing protein [Candidatus Fermentibacteria bacterium]